jgi:hypothetical protein
MKNIFSILNRAYLPNVNTIKERSIIKNNIAAAAIRRQDKDLKVISKIGVHNTHDATNGIHSNNLSKLLEYRTNMKNKEIHNQIYDSIGYKNMGGIRLEVKGRLTKRYRADRSIYTLKWKGGLKNIDSSFKGLSSVLFRGNSKSNVTYSIAKSKRRIGAFAVKGWIGGK